MTPPLVSHAALKGIRLLLLDVDGVLTDGGLYYGADGQVTKRFHVHDGLGLALLRRAGVAVGVITGRTDESVRRRAADLNLDIVMLGVADKGAAVTSVLAERGLAADEVAFVGDDVNDLPAMTRVGVSIAVANAHATVLAQAGLTTRRRGGDGAVREIADAILGCLPPSHPDNLAFGDRQ